MPKDLDSAINCLPEPVLITLNLYYGIPKKRINFYARLIERTTRTIISHLKQTDLAFESIGSSARVPRYHGRGRPKKRRRKRSARSKSEAKRRRRRRQRTIKIQ